MPSTLLIVTLAVASLLTGCTLYGDARVYGAFYRVSSEDLRAAIGTVQSGQGEAKIYALRVISADEIWLYSTPDEDGTYYETRRIRGKWERTGGAIVMKHRIDP